MLKTNATVQCSILLVENEALLRQAIEDILDMAGLKVIGVGSGQEGIAAFRANHDVINAVILDVGLPDMDGFEAFAILSTIKPTIKVIFATGYDEEQLIRRLPDSHSAAFLQKPFNVSRLLKKVWEVLDCQQE